MITIRQSLIPAVIVVVIAVCMWQRTLIMHAPTWMLRAHWADRSDLYLGKTNGISNRNLVDQARNYLTDIDHTDTSGNIIAPEALRPLDVHLDVAWFRRHAPDSVDYNPFSGGGKYLVTWTYFPDCQKAVWKSARSDPDWHTIRGRACSPVCRLSVLMLPNLRLDAIKLDTPQGI